MKRWLYSLKDRRDPYYKAALEFAQDLGYAGKTLPPFRANHTPSCNCPLAVALGVQPVPSAESYVDGGSVSMIGFHPPVTNKGLYPRAIYFSTEVARFIDKADLGHYKSLEYQGA